MGARLWFVTRLLVLAIAVVGSSVAHAEDSKKDTSKATKAKKQKQPFGRNRPNGARAPNNNPGVPSNPLPPKAVGPKPKPRQSYGTPGPRDRNPPPIHKDHTIGQHGNSTRMKKGEGGSLAGRGQSRSTNIRTTGHPTVFLDWSSYYLGRPSYYDQPE